MASSSPASLGVLPRHLEERSRSLEARPVRRQGEFVLYWMRTAVRGHENPALDVALTLAHQLDRPVFAYHALSERYPYASDRHHTFILQGARDAARELSRRGVATAFHLERSGHRGPHLAELAGRAAAVITEEMPVAPLARWTASLLRKTGAPVLTVDTACVVPMPLGETAHTRAFEFRRATQAARRERLEREWPEAAVEHPPRLPELPFEPVDLESLDLAAVLADCQIDHGVPPVPGTVGGSAAGYARWREFREHRLERYARDRNNPLRDGVSRLSPYLHYGMVSPLRIARQAAARQGDGPRKFLDELLIWRELAYHFCFHRPDHASVEALPEWALRGLREHEADPRPALFSWETLARARTGDALWDAAQSSLLRHGELHNNVRMTWGKAFVGWTPTAERALELSEDLNHRYALDGRDPASYGGILWCLGQFDRPFPPERPILGPVRARPTEGHARRLDVARYRERCREPVVSDPPETLVVGAGISGLACALTLADAGFPVRLLDKGRSPGGRVSTRRQEDDSFDHGAQYFTVRDRRFEPWVQAWAQDGVAARWRGRIVTLERGAIGDPRGDAARWVGVPGMSAIARRLAEGLEVASGVRVERIEQRDNGWRAWDASGDEHRAELLVLALPAPQALELLGRDDPLAERLAAVKMAPCLAAMVRFAEPWELPLDGAFVAASPLSWIARDSNKPGRPRGERWVLHASAEFSRSRLETAPQQFAQELLAAAREAAGGPTPRVLDLAGHRWRYALAESPLGRDCLLDPQRGLGLCGDWCPGARVEGAFLSGVALAGEVLRRAVADATRPAGQERPDRGGSEAQLALDL